MCNHVFGYPIDRKENYNPDGKTLTGICRHCGIRQKSYGMSWMIPRYDNFLQQTPIGEIGLCEFVDKNNIMW